MTTKAELEAAVETLQKTNADIRETLEAQLKRAEVMAIKLDEADKQLDAARQYTANRQQLLDLASLSIKQHLRVEFDKGVDRETVSIDGVITPADDESREVRYLRHLLGTLSETAIPF